MRKTHTLFALVYLSLLTPALFAQTTSQIPEEARRHFVKGTTLFKEAKTADDYSLVINEFKQATDIAPQWPDARYNLGLAREAAGDYSGAMADLKLYLQFKLPDTEARTIQDKIYALEAKAELAAKKKADEQTVTHYTYTFYDDFSNNNNNWPSLLFDSKYGSRSIANGRVTITALTDNHIDLIKEFPIYRTKDFEMEVTVNKTVFDGHPFGLVFCSTEDQKSKYSFLISTNGGYGVAHQENLGAWVHDVRGGNPAFNMYERNVLKIVSKDNYISIYDNNKLLQRLPFDGGYGRYFGFHVENNSIVEFSNFKLSGEKE